MWSKRDLTIEIAKVAIMGVFFFFLLFLCFLLRFVVVVWTGDGVVVEVVVVINAQLAEFNIEMSLPSKQIPYRTNCR